jgi:hypothetical protein
MKYNYADLSESQFEDLVVVLCQFLFGISTQRFSKGPDGGRDARFNGTAERYPSETESWHGITIIQAKHTNGYNESFSDINFFSEKNENCVVGKEIPKIIKLKQQGEINNYFLISNRKLSGTAESKIRNYISTKTDIPENCIALVGIEQLEIWLKVFPKILEVVEIDPIDSPLLVSPEELSEVIESLGEYKEPILKQFTTPTFRTSLEEKNKLNQMSKEYADKQIKYFLKETNKIKQFLSDPYNEELRTKYETAVIEFNLEIITNQKDYQTFDKIMNYLAKLLFARNEILNRNKKLTRAILFYMYWNCDIGKSKEE